MATLGSATIASGDTTSQAILLGGANLIAISIPAEFTNTSVKVQASFSPTDTFEDLYYNGVLVSLPATVSTKQKFVPGALVGLYAVKLVATGVGNEAAERTILLSVEGLV